MIVDCANNSNLAKELVVFLAEKGLTVTKSNDQVITEKKLSKTILEMFLKETGRSKHKVIPIDSDSFVIAIPKTLDDIGLDSCEFCGYIAHRELVYVHRRTHQGL